jgi:glycosyltransferase involved in cell wall biosynthesis
VDALVVHSEADEAALRVLLPGAHIVRTVLGQHSSCDEPAAVAREALGITDRAPVVATFGFLLPHKGVVELIRSVPLLAEAHHDVCLLVVCAAIATMRASVELRHQCAVEVRRLGLENRVALIHEFLPEPVAMTFLHAADVIVLPYGATPESASAAARFALSSGRPVMTSAQPIFDALGDAVCRIGDVSPQGIARAVTSLLADASAKADLVAAASDLTDSAEWPKLGAEFADLLDSVFE